MRSILYYITGHGYGHAVRSHQVIQALMRAAPDLQITIRTTAPRWLFDDPGHAVSYTRQATDVGLIQPNSLQIDLKATLRACREMKENLEDLIAQECRFMKDRKIALAIGDIPPACFEIAQRAEIPSVAIANFTWDLVYRSYSAEFPGFAAIADDMRRSYNKASLALTLPYPCGMSFRRSEAIPWITRTSSLTRHQARNQFGLPANRMVVLLSFGGLGLEMLPWKKLQELREFFFVTTGAVAKSQDNLRVLANAQRCYQDLLRGVDLIVTKPGYGIVADALSHQVPVLYTDRGEFPEYPHLVRALKELATAEYLPQEALLAGDLRPYLEKIRARPTHWPAVPLNGAATAAEKILALLDPQ